MSLPTRGVLTRIAAAVLVLLLISASPRSATTIAIINATLIDGTGMQPRPDAVVVVRGNRIESVSNRTASRLRSDARIIDAHGGWLLPGLIDSHVHLARFLADPDSRLDSWTHAGVTTLIENGSVLDPRDLRSRIARQSDAPRVLIAGPIFTAPGGYPATATRQNEAVYLTTPAQASRVVAYWIDVRGIDFVKVAMETGFTTDYEDSGWPTLSPEVLTAVVRTAHSKDRLVRAHVTQAHEMEAAVDAGVDVLAHAPIGEVNDAILRKAVARRVIMVSTLDLWPAAERATAARNIRRFRELGGRVALGSDFPTAGRAGLPVEELQALRDLGMTPLEIIQAATMTAAASAGRNASVGSIEAGKLADLIVIRHSPLSNIEELENVELVMRDGKVIFQGAPSKRARSSRSRPFAR